MGQIVDIIKSLLQPGSVFLLVILLLIFNSWIFNRFKSVKSDANIAKRSVSFFLVLFWAHKAAILAAFVVLGNEVGNE